MVTPAGFEPGIAAVKGRCPVRLDERAMSAPQGSCIFLCGDLCRSSGIADDNVINPDAQNCRENDDVIQRRQGLPPLPLVDGLGIAEAEDGLQILYAEPRLPAQTDDVLSGGGHVDDRHDIHFELDLLFRP